MEHPPTPPTLADQVAALVARVTLLEQRLNNWVNTRDEQRAQRASSSAARASASARTFASKYNGTCATCKQPYYATEPIHWVRIDGKSICWHERCQAPAEAR